MTAPLPIPDRQWLLDHAHLTLAEIAAAAGCPQSPDTVRNWYKRFGIPRRPCVSLGEVTRRIRAIIGEGDQARAWLAERAHVPALLVAAELGTTRQMVDGLYRRYGVAYQRPRLRPRKPELSTPYWNVTCGPRVNGHYGCLKYKECRVLEDLGERLPCEVDRLPQGDDGRTWEYQRFERELEGREKAG